MPSLYYDNRGGAGGGVAGADIRAATFVVAASDSEHNTAADYVCDGVADEVQINAALDALPANGGRVVLLDGTFVLADSIVIPDDSITLEGQGDSTYINGNALTGNAHAIIVNGHEYVTVKDFSIRTNAGGGNGTHCVCISNGSNDARIIDVHILDSDVNGIQIEGSSMSNVWIERVDIEGADVYGINVGLNDLDVMFRLHISDCEIASVGNYGIAVTSCHSIENSIITDNFIHSAGEHGIGIVNGLHVQIQGNVCESNGQSGIDISACDYCDVNDNVCYFNVRSGIELTNCQYCQVHDNICSTNDAEDSGNYDGISLFDCNDCSMQDNTCYANDRDGIYLDNSPHARVEGNYCYYNGGDGIDISSYEANIVGNYCFDNGQNGNNHGITIASQTGAMLVSSNQCGNPDQGGAQEDGIHCTDHNNKMLIVGNYCHNGRGSGIYLGGYCDDCTIEANCLWLNDDYGVEILDDTCDRTIIKDNQFLSNATGELSDSGTDTATHECWFPVGFEDATHGGRPVVELPDATDTHAYVTMQIPLDFHELVDCQFVLIAEATGNAIFTVDTTFGKICAGEQQDAHTDAMAATLLAMTDDELECFPLVDALDGIAAGDNIGVDFMRDGDHVGDDLEAVVNAVGIRLRYV